MGQHVFINGLHALQAMGNAGSPNKTLVNGCALTIGSFDGVHIGHQRILKQLKTEAAKYAVPSLVIIFEPQPHEYFSKEDAPARLMRLRDKVDALFSQGVDYVLCLRFDSQLRAFTAIDFVEQILHRSLKVKHIEIGDDFRFGCDRAGDFSLLKACGLRLGFSVSAALTYEYGNERVSSTRIRALLENNQLADAERLLGKPFIIAGRVIYGRQLGRTIGVATANIMLGRYRSPVSGVYAVEVEILSSVNKPGVKKSGTKKTAEKKSSVKMTGVANIGVKPTIEEGVKPLLEVHIFDFNQTIYGQFLRVALKHKLREEKKFNSIGALTAQIQQDLLSAKTFFG